MPTTAIKLSEEEIRLIKSYANAQRRSVSDVIRLAILDQIEDEYDLELFKKTKEEYDANPVSYSHDKIMRKHGLAWELTRREEPYCTIIALRNSLKNHNRGLCFLREKC